MGEGSFHLQKGGASLGWAPQKGQQGLQSHQSVEARAGFGTWSTASLPVLFFLLLLVDYDLQLSPNSWTSPSKYRSDLQGWACCSTVQLTLCLVGVMLHFFLCHKCTCSHTFPADNRGPSKKHTHHNTVFSWPLLAAGWWGTASPASCSPCSGQSLLIHSALEAFCAACGCCCAWQCHTPAPCPGKCPACATATVVYYIMYSKAILFITLCILFITLRVHPLTHPTTHSLMCSLAHLFPDTLVPSCKCALLRLRS